MTPIRYGDVLRHVLAGGGGWGDPFARDPDLVRRDLRNELITPGYAATRYGVVVDAATGEIDLVATDEVRRSRAM